MTVNSRIVGTDWTLFGGGNSLTCSGIHLGLQDLTTRRKLERKKNRLNKQNKICARAARALYISSPFLHDYDVKIPNFAFYEERKQATNKLYFSY